MLYFSPLSVTHGKQRDRKHPFSSFYRAVRQCKIGEDGCLVGGGGIVPCVSNKTVISIIMYVDRVVVDDDRPFIVLTETKFSFRCQCIPVWISTLLTGLGSKKTHVIMFSP